MQRQTGVDWLPPPEGALRVRIDRYPPPHLECASLDRMRRMLLPPAVAFVLALLPWRSRAQPPGPSQSNLVNRTSTGKDYRFHAAWFPQFRGADLIFWSDGHVRNWKDATADGRRIGDSIFVPAVGLVVIRQRS
jgi:hypothetical protein